MGFPNLIHKNRNSTAASVSPFHEYIFSKLVTHPAQRNSLTNTLRCKLAAATLAILTLRAYRLRKVRVATSCVTRSMLALAWIQGWFKASSAVMRSSGLYLRRHETKSLASLLIPCHSGSSSVYSPSRTASMMFLSVWPLNGG